MTPYATSQWASHSLLTVIGIVSSSIAGAVYIPMAKLMDVWGRAEGFLLMFAFSELGLIITACADDLATYCAAQVFYKVGFAGLIYAIEVLAIDASDLRNRGLAFAFTSSAYMITAFAGPAAAEAFLEKASWQWGFGSFSIIMPFFAMPIYALLKFNLRKARKSGLIVRPREKSGRTLVQNVVYWFNEFDGEFIKFSSRISIHCRPWFQCWPANQLLQSSVFSSLLLASSSSSSPSTSPLRPRRAGGQAISLP